MTLGALPSVEVLGMHIADVRRDDLVSRLRDLVVASPERAVLVFALHVGGLLELNNSAYTEAMVSADVVYADGVSAQLLARFAGAQRIERSVTTDIGWQLLTALKSARGRPARVALVGGEPGLAEAALAKMEVAGVATPALAVHGFQTEWSGVVRKLRDAIPDVVFVGLGVPEEMLWVWRYRDQLPSTLMMTCGGWFGYIVGHEPRAPRVMRRIYLEWLYRLWLDPRRLGGRYGRGLVLYPVLTWRVIRARTRLLFVDRAV